MLVKKWILRIAVGLFILIMSLLLCGVIYQFVATKLDERRYPAPGKMVDIGGYKLHINCAGDGGPSVVLDAGMGCSSLSWVLVQSEIAQFTRVCSYDRAGMGWSDASLLSRTSEHIVQELHELLKNSGVPAPYILVGHSFGGINVRLYASMYPDEVAGMVLVDSSHEDQLEKLPQVPAQNQVFAKFLHYIGFTRLMCHLPKNKKATEDFPGGIGPVVFSQQSTNKYIKTVSAEWKLLKESCKHLKTLGTRLGNKPLIVVSAGKTPTVAESPEYAQESLDRGYRVWCDLQKDLASRSTQSKRVIAEKSGHMIVFEQPEIIVDVVREMVSELKYKNKKESEC